MRSPKNEIHVNEVLKRRRKINKQQKYWDGLESDLQNNFCMHTNTNRVPKCWDGYAESSKYWYECRCVDCGKYWTEDQ